MTAVEYFFNELQRMQYFIGNDMLEAYKQSKQMEKQQIISANRDGVDMVVDKKPFITGEEYYNENYENKVSETKQ